MQSHHGSSSSSSYKPPAAASQEFSKGQVPGQGKEQGAGQFLSLMTGCPVAHNKYSLTAGPSGPVLLQDRVLLEKVTQFAREQIPPRNVHAVGFGHYGHFTLTNPNLAQYSMAQILQPDQLQQRTELFVRFSGVFTQKGEADLVRDLRGFACKLQTREGVWDLLAVNTPCFNARDMKVGPDAIHAFKRDPRTGAWNSNQTWDFVSTHPEALTTTLMIHTDQVGTPASMRMQHYWPCNTFSFLNAQGQRWWVRFHFLSQQGWKGLPFAQAKILAGEDPDFLARDVWEAIEQGNFPRWRWCFQAVPEEEGLAKPWLFDCTKVWKESDYPLIEIGTIELDRNPNDFHAEVEQAAFSPANVVPGVGFSPDRLLQGRLLVYDDTQHHRLGANFKQYPPNLPRAVTPLTSYIGGQAQMDARNRFPHYAPSLYGGLQPSPQFIEPPLRLEGDAGFYEFPGEGSDADWYAQSREMIQKMHKDDLASLVENLSFSLYKTDDVVQQAILVHFRKIEQGFGDMVFQAISERKAGTRRTPGEALLESVKAKLADPNFIKSEHSTLMLQEE